MTDSMGDPLERTTTILASGENWTLRRDGDACPVLEFRGVSYTAQYAPRRDVAYMTDVGYGETVLALAAPPDLAALLTPRLAAPGARALALTRCCDCPHLAKCSWRCTMTSREVPDGSAIPDWCPLPMYAEACTHTAAKSEAPTNRA